MILGVNSSSKGRARGEEILISKVGEGEQVIHIFIRYIFIVFLSYKHLGAPGLAPLTFKESYLGFLKQGRLQWGS